MPVSARDDALGTFDPAAAPPARQPVGMTGIPHPPRIALAIGLLVLGTGAVTIAAAPVPSSAASSAASGDDGPQFRTGVSVDITGVVDGDVYASGQNVTISGEVTGDVIAAAQTITVTGTVDGDVRLAGQDVRIEGTVERSGTIFAQTITLAEGASLGDDLVGAAGTIDVSGEVGRDLMLSVGQLTIDGSVGGDVTYSSENEARIADGAVTGTVERIAPPRASEQEVSPWAVIAGWLLGALYALVALSLVLLCAGLLAPRWLERVTDHLVPAPWKALLVGFVASIVVPMALLFLLVTIIGAPLALAGMLVWGVLTLATFVYASYYLGRLIFRSDRPPLVKTLVGGVILIVALQIPWLNILVWLGMVFFGLGAQLLEFHAQHPWRTRPDAAPDVAPDQAST